MGLKWVKPPSKKAKAALAEDAQLDQMVEEEILDVLIPEIPAGADKANPLGSSDEELIENLKDARWRLRNLYWILDKDGNEVLFTPNDVQEKFFDDIWYRNVVPKARQRGFTTAVAILALDYVIFNENFAAAMLNVDLPTALRIFRQKVKFAYDRLPPIIREMTKIVTNNKTELVFSNGSSVYVSVSTRGGTLQFLHVSELGQISKKHPDKAVEIQTGSLPSVDQNGIVIIESTVEGAAGIFPDIVRRARTHAQLGRPLAKPMYRVHWASWWDAPEYESDPTYAVISKADHDYFDRKELEISADPSVAAEWNKVGRKLSLRKRAWYVFKRDEEFGGNAEKMKSQYPTTIDEAFEVSTDGLWLGRQMAQVRADRRILRLPHDPSKPVHFFWDIGRSDDNAVWCGQEDGPWMNWLRFYESSGEAYGYLINQMRAENPYWTWGQTWLPHDGVQRQAGAQVLRTHEDIFGDLGIRDVNIVPRTLDLVDGGIEDLRSAMPLYRFDEVGCAEGILHLDGYSKVWNDRMSLWSSIVAKNGHQHGADALREHAQIRHEWRGTRGASKRTAKSKHSAAAT